MIVALALCGLAVPQQAAGWSGGALEREVRIRRLALDPEQRRDELVAALCASAFPLRWTALEALVRARAVGFEPSPALRRELARAWSAGADARAPHPNVLTAALALDLLPLDPVAHLDHPLPAVRAAALERIGRALATPDVEELLVSALDDPAARVARTAADVLARNGSFHLIERADDLGSVLRACLAFERHGLSRTSLDRWRERLSAAEGPFASSESARRRALGLVEALALVRFGAADLDVLLADPPDWSAEVRAYLRRAATRGGMELAERALELWSRTSFADPRNERWLELALEAGDPTGILRYGFAHSFRGRRARDLLDKLRPLASELDAEALAPWLRHGEAEPRSFAAQILVDRVVLDGDEQAGWQLVEMLGDARQDVGRLAFRALCMAPDPSPFQEALFAAWSGAPEETRIAWLGTFPRGIRWTPFRDAWLALGRRRAQRGPVAELLAGFVDDAVVRDTLATWLDQEAVRLARVLAGEIDGQPAVGRTRSIGVALFEVAGDDALAPLARAVELLAPYDEDCGESFVAKLGELPAGRATCRRVLSDAAALDRVRSEAALVLAPNGDAAAIDWLIAAFDSSDGELRERIQSAFGRSDDARALAFLVASATAREHGPVTRVSAVRALGARPDVEAARAGLDGVLRRAPDLDTARAAVAALGGLDHASARADLLALLAHVDGGGALSERRASWFAGVGGLDVMVDIGELRDLLLTALARRPCVESALVDVVLRGPLAAAEADLVDRLRDRSGARVEFRWRGELALGRALAEAGRLGEALARHPDWCGVDGRFLDALASVATSEPAAARRLARGALIALAGEPPTTRGRSLRFEARARLIELAERAGDWDEVERLLVRLRRDWRSRALADGGERRLLGTYDARAGVDPGARLDVAIEVARARAALAAGDLQRGEQAARRAAQRCGLSAAARDDVERLRAELDALRDADPERAGAR